VLAEAPKSAIEPGRRGSGIRFLWFAALTTECVPPDGIITCQRRLSVELSSEAPSLTEGGSR